MKTLVTFLSAGLFVLLLYSCANSKDIEAQVFKDSPYFIVGQGKQPRDLSDLKLFVPIKILPLQEVQFDSVYFRGRKAALTDTGKNGLFVAVFENTGGSGDFVMSIDPKKEYGNKVPVLPENIPYDLESDEAVIVFSRNGNKGHYKLDGVRERNMKM